MEQGVTGKGKGEEGKEPWEANQIMGHRLALSSKSFPKVLMYKE
uniref:Uncharacterized protein n=1 Tax=Trichinella nativa TaxID=6335 RepID=A0A0V1KH41_9BILA